MSDPYTYTDIDGDQLFVAQERPIDSNGNFTGPVVFISTKDSRDQDFAGVYVALTDVEQLVSAIRTAAGQDSRKWCMHCDREIEDKSRPSMDGSHSPQWVHVLGGYSICYPQHAKTSTHAEPNDRYAQEKDENARLRAELAQARGAALTEAADWFEGDGRYVSRMIGHQVATELRRMTAGGDE